MAKQRTKHGDQQLIHASIAVDDEMGMLGTALDFLLGSQTHLGSSMPEQAASNAMLRSFLLAARNLCKFLYSHKPRPTDIIAEDFFGDPEEWRKVRPQLPKELTDGSLADLISKRLAHLTWDRASGTRPTWGAFRIAWELTKALEVFVSEAGSSRLDATFVKGVMAFKLTLQATIDQHGSVELAESAPTSQLWNEVHPLWPDVAGEEDELDEEDEW